MAFELHVWGPAFSLPSVDPQCLAAIAYLTCISRWADTDLQWQMVASNDPSISPTKELPALRDASTTTIIGGLQNIIEHLRTQHPSWDLHHNLNNNATHSADQTAFTSHILTHGNPLLSLSLFISTENYSTATRRAYSALLPWPTQYIVPPTLRSRAKQLTAHLGLSSPDLDDDQEEGDAASRRNKSIIPDSLRTIGGGGRPKTVTGLLLQHQASTCFRLDALVDDFCQPLSELLGEKEYLLSDEGPSSLDCLATAYLNLMLKPDVPQDWLRVRIRQRWPALERYATQMSERLWGGGKYKETLPSRDTTPDTIASTAGKLATLALSSVSFFNTAVIYPTTTTSTPPTDAISATPLPQPQSQPHTVPTVLLTATAAAAGLAALSTYLILPYVSAMEEKKSLSKMGEVGALLSAVDFGALETGRGGEMVDVGREVDS